MTAPATSPAGPPSGLRSALPGAGKGRRIPFSRAERSRLAAMYGVIAALHLAGWGLFLSYQHDFGTTYAAAGGLAYSFGLRHAFDADHISAIDDTTRFLMQRGQRPLGVGFFFSLGHSTIVVGLCLALALAAQDVQKHIPSLQATGGTISLILSGTFLLAIAILDLLIFIGLVEVWKKTKTGEHSAEELDDLMMQRGFINRILGSRWRRFISESWQMYPVGILFGLGFETASEVGLLALTGAAATGHLGAPAGEASQVLPFGAIVALPLLFTAGMAMMDTTDGVVMSQAYEWAFKNPLRKVYYNMTTVALGIFVAAGISTVEFLQVAARTGHLHGGLWARLDGLDFETLGYFIVGSFIVLWGGSVVAYRVRGIEERYRDRLRRDTDGAVG